MEITLLADYPHEAKQIAQWYYDEWACHAPNVSKEMVLEDVAKKSVSSSQIPLAIIAREDNKLVGVAELKYNENKNYPDYVHWLGGVFVAPEHRRKGISNRLIEKSKNKAVELGIKKLYLQCESHNIKLYQKHGFQVLHSEGESSFIMVLGTSYYSHN
ncbi:GNAT family N-acetyltransferase [Vibrio albus]|uniref:GNAT family N-acetyltransferase n=1 Tax=Vibrio albus TaxID=2200953 RepID=A0A2U3B9W9_9VIBR|nr:GNAT family N-acetyltransferase [Vibrio albus]PWI33567.1 GNAT family N-acetyltransferase [Vibrio albus]